MNSPLKQDIQRAKLNTPFGEDVLVFVRMDGKEGLGELFEFRIEALSEQDLDFDKAIGQPCSVTYSTHTAQRVFHGILTEAEWLGLDDMDKTNNYRLVLRPWLWLLSRTSDCRIFQEKTAPEIIQQVFSDRGFTDFSLKLTESYPKLEYCVQYRETDLAFVSRLMEQHGIYYFFEHSSDKHMLVLADAKSSHSKIPSLSSLPFLEAGAAGQQTREHLSNWSSQRRFRSGKVQYNDYDYLQPGADLLSDAKGSARYSKSDMELYDYPGKYRKRPDGERYAKVLLESEQALDQRRHGIGTAASVFPGGLVTLEKHQKSSENVEYLVVRATHSISAHAYRSRSDIGPDEPYSGSYEFQPSSRPFRSPIVTPEPLINGIQTAKVVGKDGEEIDTDEHGRIKVEFFWDRKKSQSCWLRVAQIWSGKTWGGQFIPRVGMEVVVEFLEGDPDRPLVTGTVYNNDYKVPYQLPANKTQSGIKSNSSKGGNGYNEFMFEDKKGSENIRMHAQKDYDVVVRHVETREIGRDGVLGTSRSTKLVTGDDELTLATGSQTTTIAKNISTTAGMNVSTTAVMNYSVFAGLNVTITAGLTMTLVAGPNTIIMDPSGIKILGPTITISAVGPLTMHGLPPIIG